MKLLRIDCSPRLTDASSRLAIDRVVSNLEGVELTHRDLAREPLPHFEEEWIGANFTPADGRSQQQQDVLAVSDSVVAEVAAADALIIGAPVYNFATPARLKNWIDHLTRAGLTFRYSDSGPVGLLDNKPVRIVVASGGTQIGSPADFSTPYLRHVLAFVGLTDVAFVAATSLIDSDSAAAAVAMDLVGRASDSSG